MSEKKEEKKNRAVEMGKGIAESYIDTMNDEKKSNKATIIVIVILALFAAGSLFFNHIGGGDDVEEYTAPSENQGVFEDEEDEANATITEYSLHDEKVVGMWGSGTESFKKLEDYVGSSWIAYNFYEDGSVIQAMASDGDSYTEYGTWSTDGKGNMHISWKEKNGDEFFAEDVIYEVKEKTEDDPKILIMKDTEYTPITEATIFD